MNGTSRVAFAPLARAEAVRRRRAAQGRWRSWARERVERRRRHTPWHRSAGLILCASHRSAAGALGTRSWFAVPIRLHLSIHPTSEWWVAGRSRVDAPVGLLHTAGSFALRPRPSPSLAPVLSGATVLSSSPTVALARSAPRIAMPPRTRVRTVHRPAPPWATSPAAGRVGGPVRRRADALVVRLVQSTRRVEPPARQPAVVHERGTTAGVPGASRPGGVPAGHPAEPTVPGARASRHAGVAEPAVMLDFERLTDRIVDRLDARLVAHRERFGRAF
ncbi:hypothetical protein A4U64_26735 (plasmid) [Rhodococcus sp. WB1]|nr:hypothetical protein A4U64_26735 [Rhodococcus sp. WB1]